MNALLSALANGLISIAIFAALGTVALAAVCMFCTIANSLVVKPLVKLFCNAFEPDNGQFDPKKHTRSLGPQ